MRTNRELEVVAVLRGHLLHHCIRSAHSHCLRLVSMRMGQEDDTCFEAHASAANSIFRGPPPCGQCRLSACDGPTEQI